MWQQQKILFLRALICIKRDNTLTKLRFGAHIVIAVLLGTVFYNHLMASAQEIFGIESMNRRLFCFTLLWDGAANA
ncbi:PREDICTED: ATP-binding cassette sub-family G member 4-like [Dinoponera quadriceps]|uniref:ATP-binding cassette sub-family G member 4-like n=1 Tax=Dinoponera quadriceps TaxID=609295 RepID=A0A6P3YA43_DINQU|nr:PREDICTED: ATP-binding cassette sub-family G member 4-like [Dinoponera quadriceps]